MMTVCMVIGMLPAGVVHADGDESGGYSVNFGSGVFQIGETDVTVTVNGEAVSGDQTVSEEDVIGLEGFDADTMIAKIEGANDFQAELNVEAGQTTITALKEGVLPEGGLKFSVVQKPQNEPDQKLDDNPDGNPDGDERVEFTLDGQFLGDNIISFRIGDADVEVVLHGGEVIDGNWYIDEDALNGAYVTAGEGFDTEKMGVFVRGANQFSSQLEGPDGDGGYHFSTEDRFSSTGCHLGVDLLNNGPGPDDNEDLHISFTAQTVGQNTIRFKFDDEDIDLTLHGGELTDDEWTISADDRQNAYITVSASYDPDKMEIALSGPDNFGCRFGEADAEGKFHFPDNPIPDGCSLFLAGADEDPGPDPRPEGDTKAIINLSGPEGSWSIAPMVWEDYDVVTDEYSSAPYDKYATVVSIAINEGRNTESLSQYYKDADFDRYKSQEVSYDKREDGTVSFEFSSNWGNRIEKVVINGVNYNIPLNYDSRHDWLWAFHDQGIGFVIDGIP